MAPLTQIQKAVYANQTMAMERESVLRAAKVVAKARKELLAKVQAAPKTTSIQQATLSSLDAVIKTLPQDIMRALRTDELVEKGYRQGRSLLLEVAKGTDAEGKLSGFAGILDLRTYSQDANQAVAQIKGLSEQAKAQIKASAEVSLALGEGEVDTMRRLFGDIDKPGDKTPFRSLKISAERIARTVTNSLVNSGKSSAYQQYANEFPELGILNEWVNVTDFRTSDTCRALVGQKRPPGQAFQGGGFSGFHPPAHIQCRSTIIPTIGELVEPEPTPEPDTAQIRKELATKLRDRGNIFADLATKDGLGESTPEWVDGVDRQNFSIGIRLIQLADQIENDKPFRTTDDSLQFISYLRALQDGNTKTLVEEALKLARTTPEQDKEIAQWAKPLIEDGVAPQFLIDATNRFRATRNLPPIDGTLPPSTTTPAPQDPEPTQPSEANLDERIEALFGVERDRKLKALYKKASEAKTEAESNKIWEEIEEFEEANPYTGGVDFIEEMERLGNPRDALISDYSSGRYSDYNRPTDHTKQKLLVEVLAEKPKFVGKSYRFSDIVEGVTEVGGTITSGDAFLSTSKNRNSKYITDRKGFILEIEGRSGVDISPYSRFEDEAEILYSPGTEFEVVAKRKVGPHTYLTVREKGGSSPLATPQTATLDGQIKKGGEFVAAVLSRGEVSRLTKMSKDFHRDMDLYFNKGDGEAFERIRAAVKDVAPLATKLKEALEAQNSEGLNIKTGYSRKNGVVGEAESIDWTDQTGKTHKVKLDSSLNDHPQAFRMSGLVKDVVKLTGGSSLEGATLVYLDQNRGKSPSRDRGWAEHATKTINVGGKQGRDLGSTMLHETAHFIEYDVPGAKEASMELIKRRATGPVMSLADVDPVYRDDELFMPDEFVSPYVGKIYPGSSPGTEVLSIGLQHLVTPELTAEFMLRDPEHFNYALSYLVKKIPQPAPEPVKVKAPTFDEYLKSLPKSEQEWLKDYLQKVEEDYWLTAEIGDLEAPGKLMDKWKAVYAKSAHTLAQTPKVKVISDKGGLKEHQESFEMFGHNVTMTLAKPFDWNAFTGRETNEPPEFPKVSVVFVTDGGFNPKIKDPKEAMAIASEVKKRLNAAMAEMPDGTVMVNEPVGGTLGKRAFIYSMQGWGPCGPDGKQYAVIKGGKAVPLSIRNYEKLQKTGEI